VGHRLTNWETYLPSSSLSFGGLCFARGPTAVPAIIEGSVLSYIGLHHTVGPSEVLGKFTNPNYITCSLWKLASSRTPLKAPKRVSGRQDWERDAKASAEGLWKLMGSETSFMDFGVKLPTPRER
jgi:hypothetical protein